MNPAAFVFWIDAGSCREQQYDKIQFPNPSRMLIAVPSQSRGAMIFAFWRNVSIRRQGFIRIIQRECVIGTFFGGDETALRQYSAGFWAIHDYFLEHGQFVGKEQPLMSTYFVYASKAWVQPNYEGRCCSWFSTFSFYSDPKLCFEKIPKLLPHRTYFDKFSNWTFSLENWMKSIKSPSHSFARRPFPVL
jgi:hypothetical protein